MSKKLLVAAVFTVFGAASSYPAFANDPSTIDLFKAVQNNHRETVQQLLKGGANVNAHDDMGATPLMYAAVYAVPEVMKALLDKGADPNAANRAGATALMWGIGDMQKVRLLIDRGANVNAHSQPFGLTPLLLAVRHPGSNEIVKLLIAKGADIHAVETIGVNAISLAAAAGNVEALKILLDKGVTTEVKQTERGFDILNLGSEVLEAVARRATRAIQSSTPLMAAVLGDNAEAVKLLLAKKPEIDAATGTGITALFLAAPKGNPEMVKLLLDAGANPNLADERGFTPLILAAGSEMRNADVVRLLLAKGAKLDAKDAYGETPLTWARKLGDNPVVKVLRDAGATGPDPEIAVVPARAPEKPDIHRSIEKSLALLQSNGPTFFKKSGCISCHNVSIPLMAMNVAREHGFTVDKEVTSRLMKSHLATLGPHRENLMQTNCTIPGLATTTTYGLISMKMEGYPADGLTDAIVHCLANDQRPDGHWSSGDTRPPLGTGTFASTALSVRTLRIYMPEGRKAELENNIDRARKWLSTAKPSTNDDLVYRLFGFAWANAPADEVQKAARALLDEQRSDGGWAQLPEMTGDAFATGHALAALHEAGGMPASDPRYQRGVQYLLRTQLEDGSWHVKSRAFGFQPYFESGFPHGHDQWISAAATSWATMALVYGGEPKQIAAR